MNFALSLDLQSYAFVNGTPGGVTDVWLWEAGIGLLWEPSSLMKLS